MLSAPRRAATSSSRWHRKWRATSTSNAAASSYTAAHAQAWAASPPIQQSYTSTGNHVSVAQTFPHAETSAAGAARYSLQHSTSLKASSASPPTIAAPTSQQVRTVTTTSLGKQRRSSSSRGGPASIARPDRARLEAKLADLPDAISDRGGDVVRQWLTAEEIDLASAGMAHDAIRGHVRRRDRAIIRKATQRHALTMAYDFLGPLSDSLADGHGDEAARQEWTQQALDTMDLVSRAAPGHLTGPSALAQPLSPADQAAFKIVYTAIMEVQIRLQFSDQSILTCLDQVQQWLGPFSLPLYHRLIVASGSLSRYALINQLLRRSFTAWQGTTDEWLLFAQAKVWVETGQQYRQADFRAYWEVYARHRAAPPEASDITFAGVPADSSPQKALRPPAYLFTFLLRCHLDHVRDRATSGSAVGLVRPAEVLQAILTAGHPVDETVWTLLVQSSANLRLGFSEMLHEVVIAASNDGGDPKPILLQLLRRRADALAARDVLRLLRLVRVQAASWSRQSAQKQGDSAQVTQLKGEALFQAADLAEALAVTAKMFGQLGHPARALAVLRQLSAMGSSDAETRIQEEKLAKYKQQAITAVMQAYISAGEAQRALAFGLAVVGQGSAIPELREDMICPLSSTILAALLRAAAALPSMVAKVSVGRWLMTLARKRGIGPSKDVYRGLASFAFVGMSTEVGDFKQTVRALEALRDAAETRSLASSPETAKEQDSMQMEAASNHLGAFLQQIDEIGVSHHIELQGRRRTWFERQKQLRAQDRRDSEHQSTAWMRGDHLRYDLPQDLNGSAAFASELSPDMSFPTPATMGSWESGEVHEHDLPSQKPLRPTRRQTSAPPSAPSRGKASALSLSDVIADGRDHASATDRSDASIDTELRRDMTHPLLPSAYALRLRVYATNRRDHKSALYIYRSMLRHGVRPTMAHIGPIVEGLALDGRIDDAKAVSRAAQDRFGLLSTPRIEAAIVRQLIRNDRADEAMAQLTEWSEKGGVVDDYMRSLFDPVPALADPTRLRHALERCKTQGTSLAVPEVDEAYRFLCHNARWLSAQRLLVLALATGMQPDWELKGAVRDTGNYLRKLQMQRGITPRELMGQVDQKGTKEGKTPTDRAESQRRQRGAGLVLGVEAGGQRVYAQRTKKRQDGVAINGARTAKRPDAMALSERATSSDDEQEWSHTISRLVQLCSPDAGLSKAGGQVVETQPQDWAAAATRTSMDGFTFQQSVFATPNAQFGSTSDPSSSSPQSSSRPRRKTHGKGGSSRRYANGPLADGETDKPVALNTAASVSGSSSSSRSAARAEQSVPALLEAYYLNVQIRYLVRKFIAPQQERDLKRRNAYRSRLRGFYLTHVFGPQGVWGSETLAKQARARAQEQAVEQTKPQGDSVCAQPEVAAEDENVPAAAAAAASVHSRFHKTSGAVGNHFQQSTTGTDVPHEGQATQQQQQQVGKEGAGLHEENVGGAEAAEEGRAEAARRPLSRIRRESLYDDREDREADEREAAAVHHRRMVEPLPSHS